MKTKLNITPALRSLVTSVSVRGSAAISLVVLGTTSLVHAATTTPNLLVDPGFENQATLPSFASSVNDFPSDQGTWGAENGVFTGAIDFVNPLGLRMLGMETSGTTTQSIQITSLAPYAADIAAGGATFNMSALFNLTQVGSGATGAIAVRFFTSDWSSRFAETGNSMVLDNTPKTWESISHSGSIPTNAAWIGTEVLFNSASLNGTAGYVDQASLTITTVPEPSSALLLGLGGIGLLMRRKRA